MTGLEVLDYIDREIEKERRYKSHCQSMFKYYCEVDDLEEAIKQKREAGVYSHSIANYLILKNYILKQLDEEASRAYEEMRAND